MTAGLTGADYVGQLCKCPYPIGTATGQAMTETGYNYQLPETDSKMGANYYSIQLNSNTYSITYNGVSTMGWTQFVLAESPSGAQIYVQWWLLGYASNGRSCPFSWYASGSDCFMNSSTNSETFHDAGSLTSISLGGSATSTQDTLTYCFAGTCDSVSGPDTVFLSQNWYQVEWNVVGYCCLSEAIFNQGAYLQIGVSLGFPDPETMGCTTGGTTGEGNNMNLGSSCSTPYLNGYVFDESVPNLHCPPAC